MAKTPKYEVGAGKKRQIEREKALLASQAKFYPPDAAVGIVSRQLARRNGICARKRPDMSLAAEKARLRVSSRLLAGVRL